MTKDGFRNLDSGSHQKSWPVHSVKAQDVFSNQMHGRPIFRKFRVIGCKSDSAEISGESIEPNVKDMVRIVRQRNSPLQCCSADGKVPQSTAHKRCDFVPA